MRLSAVILLIVAALQAVIAPRSATAALSFQCVEPSRYRNLLPIFNDDPSAYFGYFRTTQRQLPPLESCRSLIINGVIGSGDAEALLGKIIAGQGGLAVLYLAFDGTNVVEEARMAVLVRTFYLKTKAVRGAGYAYFPDFASRWNAAVPLGRTAGSSPPPVASFSPLDEGLRHFAARTDLRLPVAKEHAFCLDGCWTVWFAGVNRTRSAAQAPAAKTPASADAATTRQRELFSRYIDSGRWPAANDSALVQSISGAPFWTAAADHMLRQSCDAELAVVQSLAGNLTQTFDAAAAKKFDPPSVEGMAPLLERLNRAGARIEQCYAVAYEEQRNASFRRQCPAHCDRPVLSERFNKMADKLLLDAGQIK